MLKKFKPYIFVLLLILIFTIIYLGYISKKSNIAINGYYKLNIETNIKDSSGANF